MQHACRILNLYNDIIFNTLVRKAVWCDKSVRWSFYANEVDDEVIATAQFYLPCTGYTGQKYIPELKGLGSFKHAYHTSEYPAGLSTSGRRVGVIGTGSSGIQTIETIGPLVEHLTVFQRTPNLANPRYQETLSPESEKKERQTYQVRYEDMKATPTGGETTPIDRTTFSDSIKDRLATYESLWQRGSQNFWFGNYKDMLRDRKANLEAYGFWRDKVRARINDPVKRELLAPVKPPHAFGTKRPSLESGYFEVYNQPNVDLIDLNTDDIVEVTPDGVLMKSGRFHELDILVLATGFDFGIGTQLAIEVRGMKGITLADKWGRRDYSHKGDTWTTASLSQKLCSGFNIHERLRKKLARRQADDRGVLTYLGIMCTGFPNMLMSLGPQAPTALSITPRLAELQGNWIAECLAYVREHGTVIETTKKAELAWKAEMQRAAEATLIPGTDGWYMSNSIRGQLSYRTFESGQCLVLLSPGRKKEPLFWFGGVPEYMAICNESAKDGYEGFAIR